MDRRSSARRIKAAPDPPPSTLFQTLRDAPLDADKWHKIQTLKNQAPSKARPTPWPTPRASQPPAEILRGRSFVARVRNTPDEDDALDVIYQEIDVMLRRSDFTYVDEILAAVDMSLPVVHLLAFVSISRAAREHLSAWVPLVSRVREHLTRIEPDRVGELLRGFG